MRGITAGLLMLGKSRAVEVMENVGRALGTIVRPGRARSPSPRLDRLADAIVSVEYYMETLQAGRADPWYMLDAADTSLGAVEPSATRIVPLRSARTGEAAASLEPPAPPPVAAPSAQTVAPAPPPAPAAPAATTVDREFVDLFIEEARENVTRLQTLYPQWEQNPLDAEALRDVRRAFHTLKGSGRMVGARRVGEFSWSIESVLNRVISQTLARSPDIVAVVRDAVAAMPQLVDEIESGVQATVDVDAIMARADALSGREATGMPALPSAAAAASSAPTSLAPAVVAAESSVPTIEPPVEAEIAAVVADATSDEPQAPVEPSGMDPVLREIYRKETAGHIAVVREFIERCGRGLAPYHISEALYRACHTLSGISKTARARQGIKVAEPMEHYVRKLFDNGHGLPEEGLALLRDTVRLLETVSEHVDDNTGFFPEQGRLVTSWHALDRSLDAELARLADAAERTVGELWPPPGGAAQPDDLAEPSLAGLSDVPSAPAETPVHPVATGAASVAEPEPESGLPPAPVVEHGAEPAMVEDEQVGADAEFDADIAAIFGEEATELLEQADGALARWVRDRADTRQVTELKRLLHTLKGGARMAGIRAMGDVSHELESFLAAVESGAAHADSGAVEVLQASIDELQQMRETASSGQQIPAPVALLARIRAVARAHEPVVDQPAVEPAPVDAELEVEPQAFAPEPVVERPASHVPMASAERDVAALGLSWPVIPTGEELVQPEVPEAADYVAAQAPPVLPGREPVAPSERQELARVDAELLDQLLNHAGEVSIAARASSSRWRRSSSTSRELVAHGDAPEGAAAQARDRDRGADPATPRGRAGHRADFDPLELDRYSSIQQFSRALAESVSDVGQHPGPAREPDARDAEPAAAAGPHRHRAAERPDAHAHGARSSATCSASRASCARPRPRPASRSSSSSRARSGELDRQVLERMLPPFEHMLRNVVVHGIETPERAPRRRQAREPARSA